MKNFFIRTISGAVFVALIVGSILLFDNSPIAFLCLMSVFIVLATHEVYSMTSKEEPDSWSIFAIDSLGGIGLFVSLYYMSVEETSTQGLWLTGIATYILVRTVVQLYRPRQNAVHSLCRSFFSIIYIVLPLGMLNSIIAMSSPRTLLAIFCFIWINDSGAFLTGVTLGHHKLFVRISPKKSWEGFLGGFVLVVLAAFASHRWLNDLFQCPQIEVWVGLSIVVALAATFGDLVESLIKRTLQTKDSGHIIPGHGGILDRIDSLLLVAPAALIYLALIVYNNI